MYSEHHVTTCVYRKLMLALFCRDSFYEAKMQEQLQELEQLRDERHKLLAIQQELQSLHDRFSVVRIKSLYILFLQLKKKKRNKTLKRLKGFVFLFVPL